MFDKLSDSWDLVKASAGVLRQDKELLWLPVMSFLATLVVLASFAFPMLAVYGGSSPESRGVVFWVFGFLFYLSQYFVIFFFNSALVGAALMRLEGKDPTLKDALGHARGLVVPLLGYAAIAATVGMVLRAIQERAGFLGQMVVGLLGMGWTVATFLVVPVLVSRQMGPVEAIQESTRLLKKTWGQNVAGHLGIGAVFAVGYFVVMLGTVFFGLAAASFSGELAVLVVIAGLVVVLGMGVYQSALMGVYQAALYRFAHSGDVPEGFSQDQVAAAFLPK